MAAKPVVFAVSGDPLSSAITTLQTARERVRHAIPHPLRAD